MIKSHKRRATLLGTAGLLLYTPGFAQQAAPDAPVIEQVTVTASKRTEKLQDVPVSVTALTGAQLEQEGATQFTDYASRVPGLTFAGGGQPGHSQLIVRGLNTGDQSLSSTVGTYLDDAPFGSTGGLAFGASMVPDPDLSDISDIEVLKGPQGTLYGASTLGGLLKIGFNKPDLDKYEGMLSVNGGVNDDGATGSGERAMVNIPIIDDKLALRASFFNRTDPGYIDDVGIGQKDANRDYASGGRVSLLAKPTDDLTIQLSVFTQGMVARDSSTVELDPATLKPAVGGLASDLDKIEPGDREHYWLYTANIQYDFGPFTVTNIASEGIQHDDQIIDETLPYGILLPAGSDNLAIRYNSDTSTNKFTDELRFASPSNHELEWLGGLFYTFEHSNWCSCIQTIDTTTQQQVPGALGNFYTSPINSAYQEYAAFGDITYYLTPEIDVTVGARWSRNRQSVDAPETGVLTGGGFNEVIQSSADQSWTYLLTGEWHITPDEMTYFRIAKGYSPGGPTVVPTVDKDVPSTYMPDTTWNYEIGAKSTLLDGRMTLDASAYYIDWSQIQLNTLVNGFTILANGGSATSKGVEFDTQYTPINGLKLGLNGSYNDASIDTDAVSLGALAGDPLPLAPRWQLSANADYSFPLNSDDSGVVGGVLSHTGSRYSSFELDPLNTRYEIPAYTTVNLRAGIEGDSWELMFRINNLFNEQGYTNLVRGQVIPSQDLPLSATVIPPRTYGLSFTKYF